MISLFLSLQRRELSGVLSIELFHGLGYWTRWIMICLTIELWGEQGDCFHSYSSGNMIELCPQPVPQISCLKMAWPARCLLSLTAWCQAPHQSHFPCPSHSPEMILSRNQGSLKDLISCISHSPFALNGFRKYFLAILKPMGILRFHKWTSWANRCYVWKK